jgi:hypothetical protein
VIELFDMAALQRDAAVGMPFSTGTMRKVSTEAGKT